MQAALLLGFGQHQVDVVATSLGGQEIQGLLYGGKPSVLGDQLYLVGKVTQTATRVQEVKGFRERLAPLQVNNQTFFHRNLLKAFRSIWQKGIDLFHPSFPFG
jgi:hypothetical protein